MTCPLTAADEKMKQMAEPLQEFNKVELITMMVGMELENEKLKKENKKYFDENQKYKEENTEYRVKYEHKDNDYTQMKQLKSAYGQQKAILKKENKNLKKIIKTNNEHFNDVENKCTKLELENEELNSQIQEYENTEAYDIQEIKELQREHDEWEEEALDMREELAVIRNKLGNICFDCDYDWEKHIIDKLKDKIDLYPLELKKENEELTEIKDAIALHCCCETDPGTTMEYTHALIKDINKLKALVKDLGII